MIERRVLMSRLPAQFKNLRVKVAKTSRQGRGYPVTCLINGPENSPYLVFAGGLIYGEMLLALANQMNAQVVLPLFPWWYARPITELGYKGYENIGEVTME